MEEKHAIISAYNEIKTHQGAKAKICKRFNLATISTLDAILKKEFEITGLFTCAITDRKHLKASSYPELDQKLYGWFLQIRCNKVEISGDGMENNVRTSPCWMPCTC